MGAVNGITAITLPWYASRATGVVALVLLTAVMVLGIVINRQGGCPGCPGSVSPACTGTCRCWR